MRKKNKVKQLRAITKELVKLTSDFIVLTKKRDKVVHNDIRRAMGDLEQLSKQHQCSMGIFNIDIYCLFRAPTDKDFLKSEKPALEEQISTLRYLSNKETLMNNQILELISINGEINLLEEQILKMISLNEKIVLLEKEVSELISRLGT